MNITLSSPAHKIILMAALLLLLIVAGNFVLRTAMAERLTAIGLQTNEQEIGTRLGSMDAAIRFAPNMASAYYQRGLLYLEQANGDETAQRLNEATGSLQKAAELSPTDYRIQIALGQALSRQEKTEQAQLAFQQAKTLAPNYYAPRWALGNFLLRNNDAAAAFTAFREALTIRPTEIPILFDYAWNAYNNDPAAILQALAPPNDAKAQLASLFVTRGKAAEGLKLWQELQAAAPNKAREQAQNFISALVANQQFGAAYSVWQQAAKTQNPRTDLTEDQLEEDAQWFTSRAPDTGSFLQNGGFEQDLAVMNAPPFLAWHLTATRGLTVSRDNTQFKAGAVSLKMNFDVPGNASFVLLEQAIPVKPSARYHLSFAAKTEELITLSAPIIEVFDPADTKRLRAATPPLPLRNNDWNHYALDFAAAAATEMVVVRMVRFACGEPPCPIKGKIWLDDFKLEQR